MKTIFTKFFTLMGLTMLISCMASAQDPFGPDNSHFGPPSEGDSQAKIKIISSVKSAAPGKPFMAAILVEHPGEWHSYYKNAGSAGSPLKFKLDLPEGFTASELQWPVPHVDWAYDMLSFSYGHNTYFLTTITPATDAKVGQKFTIGANVTVQMCKGEKCNPPSKVSGSIELSIASNVVVDQSGVDTINKAKKALPTDSEDWKFSTKKEGNNLIVNVQTNTDLSKVKKPIFLTDAGILDIEKAHKITKADNGYTLTVPLQEDAEVPATLSGIFTTEDNKISEGVKGISFKISAQEATSSDNKIAPVKVVPEATKEEPEAKKEESPHYDASDVPDDKISLIDLARLDDKGNVLDSNGKIVPVDEVFADADRNLVDKDGKIRDKKTQTTFLLAALLIFAGGLILNLMPCVFPVLGVKVLGFVQLSGNDPAKIKKHGLVFTLGVLISMWILAGVILAIKAYTGDAVPWGAQMKSPIFVGSMAILLSLFALNLYGVFEVGTSLTSAGGNLQSKKGYQGSFFSGILTTLIATPCGAPLLATAMTYTLQQTAFLAMILFTIFGLGVAFPYLVLSFLPKLIDKLPRPGGWMVTFKKSMAFPLLATVAFMLTVFIKQTGTTGITWMIWSLVTLATAAFIYGTWSPPFTPAVKRYLVGFTLSIAVAACGGYMGYIAMTHKPERAIASSNHDWTHWKPNIVDQSRKKGRVVWIDYTADW